MAIAVMITFWAAGFLVFFVTLQKPEQHLAKVDPSLTGIAVLTGGSGRLDAGLALLSANKAKRLLLSGVHTSVTVNDLVRLSGADANIFECCVDLDRTSVNTIDNAAASAVWAQKHQYKSLYLVTSAYHVPRSLLLFEAQLPDAQIIPIYVETPLSISAIIVEYNKYLFTAAQMIF